MKKKIIWSVVSCLMVLSLVLTSCTTETESPTTSKTSTTPAESTVTTTTEEEQPEEVATTSDEPQYGGVITYQVSDPLGFDEAYSATQSFPTLYMTNSKLLAGDWAKGPSGAGETDWKFGIVGKVSLFTGDLASSWELIPPDTLIFHIRKGVRWHDKQPVNGRELTAEDVSYSLNRTFLESKGSYLYARYAGVGTPPESIKAIDKYTVEIKVPPELLGNMVVIMGNMTHIVPHEVIEEYGDMKDWKNSVGTGPWMLTDYVSGSSMTFVRNPNYFMNDPLHPENQLPYMDGVQWLNIPDKSTEESAFRTGKIDRLTGVSWQKQELLLEQCPSLVYTEVLSSSPMPVGRQDKEDLPFKDIRVRQALNLAVNQQEILDGYYSGRGVLFAVPMSPTAAHANMFTPLEEQSEVVQELFEYHPDKARQLLTEAGYPDGFSTEIICRSTSVDFLSMVREYLLEVNVDMEIRPLERSIYTSSWKGMTFKEMMTASAWEWKYPQSMSTLSVSSDNPACFNYDKSHERVNEAYKTVVANVGIDDVLWQQTLKDLYPYILEQASMIWMPAYYSYTMWWPWVGSYSGETNVGYADSYRFLQHIWINTELKNTMGY